MCESIDELVAGLQKFVENFDPQSLDRDQSKEMFDRFVLVERLGAAGKALTSLRAAETNVWWDGHRSPAHYVAHKSKCSVGRAVDIMDTAELMRRLPETEAAFRRGALSEQQAIEVVSAAAMDVASQEELLEIAELESLAELHRQASRVRAVAMDAELKRARAHQRRRLTHWTDIEGVFHLDARMTPESGAVVMTCLQPFLHEITRKAARDKIKESSAAHLADALVAMADKSRCVPPDAFRPGPSALVHLRLDLAALERGHLQKGEICEVPGIGPVSLEAARHLLADSRQVIIGFEDEDIRMVKGVGHTIPDKLRRAVYERCDYRCVVPGCTTCHDRLEIDHTTGVKQGGPTTLYNLALLCHYHHRLKTFHGYRLQHYRYRWIWLGPNDPPPDEDSDQPELTTFFSQKEFALMGVP
jgi:5-methylcytosine-specific restriction endonuclease McrA